ncbi:MAG: thioredoxin family protein [Nitrospirae bacterium]|nr:thioredoxin family protein [Nitrospirota bacterium]
MALTNSTMLALGTELPVFQLPDVVSGQIISPETFAGKTGILVMFICRHCPYVVHIKEELARLGKDYEHSELGIVAISSNDAKNYREDSPDRLKTMAQELRFTYPYCYDESQHVAKLFTAACTPDFFLFNKERKLVYRGQLDKSRPGNNKPVTGKDVREAIEAVLRGQSVSTEQQPSVGCNIKWKPGNAPLYG